MAKRSVYLIPTLKEDPADSEALSHKLMVRAGLIRQLGAGLWTYLPAGWRVQRKIEAVIREEMDAIGAQEILMPVMQPAEVWKQTGRYEISELFKLDDRQGKPHVLAMTHEENVTFHVAKEVKSYRDLPLILYHLQTKERDEPRPRAGVLRTREFIMKDSYSFDCDEDGLAESYDLHIQAYDRIFDRCGIEWYRVESDVGMMGGLGAHEYMAPCPAGENEIALCGCGYAANVEIATAKPAPTEAEPARFDKLEELETPNVSSVDEVAVFLGVPHSALMKSVPFVTDSGESVLVLVRGDHTVNEIKLQNHLGEAVRPAAEDEIRSLGGEPGFIGPLGLSEKMKIVIDSALEGQTVVTGANRQGYHVGGVEVGVDFAGGQADVRSVADGDFCPSCDQAITVEKAIEVGNIFKLGTRYSEPLGARYLDVNGREQPVVMGSYGIGPARIAAAAVEQKADEHGIVWPKPIAPFEVEVVSLGKPGTPETKKAEDIYNELKSAGAEVLFDDREVTPGQKFADAELIGVPLRLTVGGRGLKEGVAELQVREGRSEAKIPLGEVVSETVKKLSEID